MARDDPLRDAGRFVTPTVAGEHLFLRLLHADLAGGLRSAPGT